MAPFTAPYITEPPEKMTDRRGIHPKCVFNQHPAMMAWGRASPVIY
jgi:hypothetical protein